MPTCFTRLFGVVLILYFVSEREVIAAKTNAIDKSGEETSPLPDPWRLVEKLKAQIGAKESELENAEQINRGFESMIQLINIMSQVDTFVEDRTHKLLKKLATLADNVDTKSNSHQKQKT